MYMVNWKNPAFDAMDRIWNANEEADKVDFQPEVDIWEDDKSFEIALVLPGFSKEQMNIEVNDGDLIVSGTRERIEGKKAHRLESHYGNFRKVFTLPDAVKADKISASHKDGILTVTVPKDVKKLEARKIKVD